MRRLLLLLMSCSLTVQAQVFQSVRLEKLSGSTPGDCRIAGISPDGSYVLTTTQTNKGLRQINLKTGQTKLLTDNPGAGFQPHVSTDGRSIVCRKVTFDEHHMRQTALELLDIEHGTQNQLRAPAREVREGNENGRAEVFIEDMQLMVSVDGVTRNLSPNGNDDDTRYIWPSLSPNGKRILYYVSGEGAYVCNLEGKEVRFIAHNCRAPQWYDDDTIVGMNDRDDGKMLLSSSIMAYTLDGKVQELTDSTRMLMYPQCCAPQGIIVCSAANGEIFVLRTRD
ncbi:MAG: PD40 domain-containing protein [Bacteroidaceae bacterium]|nr:PD40 domain-containing protein [Bacteroidaceae bacterium]